MSLCIVCIMLVFSSMLPEFAYSIFGQGLSDNPSPGRRNAIAPSAFLYPKLMKVPSFT